MALRRARANVPSLPPCWGWALRWGRCRPSLCPVWVWRSHGGEGLRGLLVLCALWLTLAAWLRGEGGGEGSLAVIIINSVMFILYRGWGEARRLISYAFKRYFLSPRKLRFCGQLAYVLLDGVCHCHGKGDWVWGGLPSLTKQERKSKCVQWEG